MGEEKRVGILGVTLVFFLVAGSLKLPLMAARPLGGKLGFEVETLALESLPKGTNPSSEHSCGTHSNIACPPSRRRFHGPQFKIQRSKSEVQTNRTSTAFFLSLQMPLLHLLPSAPNIHNKPSPLLPLSLMAFRSFKLTSKLPFLRRPASTTAGDAPSHLPIPSHFLCPISLDLMKDPVILPTGITFDRSSIETWLESGNLTCPVTKTPLFAADLIPNHTIRRLIQDWCAAHRSLGVDRIPTPKIPITSLQVADLLSEISAAHHRGNGARCAELIGKLKNWAAESDRNRRCISSNGAARVVSAVFQDFPSEQLLSALAGMLPLDEEARRKLVSDKSVNSIVSIMRNGNLSGRLNAVLVVKEIVLTSSEEECGMIARSDELIEAIVKLLKEPISPQATKASLVAAYHLASSGKRAASRFAEAGIVSTMLEMIVDSERSVCEKGLAVLDAILSSEAGRKAAAGHELAMPVLVKKMLRVSDVATESAVSAAWKLCKKKGNGGEEKLLKEAVEVGAFEKLLLTLQVGCGESTKEKACDLLRMLNGFRERIACIESVDFKGLKRSF